MSFLDRVCLPFPLLSARASYIRKYLQNVLFVRRVLHHDDRHLPGWARQKTIPSKAIAKCPKMPQITSHHSASRRIFSHSCLALRVRATLEPNGKDLPGGLLCDRYSSLFCLSFTKYYVFFFSFFFFVTLSISLSRSLASSSCVVSRVSRLSILLLDFHLVVMLLKARWHEGFRVSLFLASCYFARSSSPSSIASLCVLLFCNFAIPVLFMPPPYVVSSFLSFVLFIVRKYFRDLLPSLTVLR